MLDGFSVVSDENIGIANAFDKLPNKGTYKIILADPPWQFKTFSEKGKGRSAERHYHCMSLKDIMDLPVMDIVAKDAILLFWVTDPFLPKGIEVMKSWGFEYKTVGFTWAKTNKKSPGFFMGTGYYTRANPEMCLIGRRGKTIPRAHRDVRQLIVSKVREHSRKPDETHERIERLYEGHGPFLELFAREERPNWVVWGNEVDKFSY